MLTGRYEGIPSEGTQVTPSTWTSMSDSFAAAFQTPLLMTPYQTAEHRRNLLDHIKVMESVANMGDQGLFQRGANWVAGFAGGALNPYAIAGGELGAGLAGGAIAGVSGLIGRYAPFSASVLGTALAQKEVGSLIGRNVPAFVGDATLGGLGKGALIGFSAGTGFSLPQELATHYNDKNDEFNWWGGVKSSFADGGFALKLMAVPYLAGTAWGKLFRAAGKEVPHEEIPLHNEGALTPDEKESGKLPTHPALAKIDEAEANGHLDKPIATWLKDYITGNDTNEKLSERAIQLLIKDGHPVDAASQKVILSLFKPEEVSQLNIALIDQLASTVPENIKSLFKDFLINHKIDGLHDNQKMFDGIQGIVQFIKKRLAIRPEEEINLNKILRRFLPDNLKIENPFTQYKIYRALKAKKSIGVNTPYQVKRLLAHDKKMANARNKADNYEKQFKKTGKIKYEKLRSKTINELIELEKNKPQLLSHQDEIKSLRDELLSNGKVAPNFKAKLAYHRLSDLTRVRNDARRLMHELHVKHEYDMHDHYATVLNAISNIMKASIGKLANHDNVINYMKERYIRTIPELAPIEEKATKAESILQAQEATKAEHIGEEANENKAFKDDQVKSYEKEMKEAPDEIKKEFNEIKNQFNEFNEKQSIFKNLIKCVIGSMHG